MDSQLQSISKIFTEKLFRIPDYQRGYAWGDKQLKDFWNDILQLETGKHHYVGVLTLEKVPKSIYSNWEDDEWIIQSKSYQPFYIVDGQQRITTTIVLIQAITELYSDNDKLNYTEIQDIKKRYIFDSKDDGISRSYIFGYEKDNPSYDFLKSAIFLELGGYKKEDTIYTNNLEKAKYFFLDKLSKLEKQAVEAIYKKITQNLLFNIYTISSDIDVFIAFETMNNRGKPLSNLELLKNRLIYLSTKFNTENTEKNKLRKSINDSWKSIYHYLGKNKDKPLSDDFFLLNHFIIYFGHSISNSNGDDTYSARRMQMVYRNQYESFLLEEKFTVKSVTGAKEEDDASDSKPVKKLTVRDVHTYVNSLQKSVEVWYNIHNPTLHSEFSDEEIILLNRLLRLNTRAFLPLVLVAYQIKSDSKTRLELLDTIERYTFLQILTSFRLFFDNFDFSSNAIKVFSENKSVSDITKSMNDKIIETNKGRDFLDDLSKKFKSEDFYKWSGIRYFLFEYEQNLKSKSKTSREKLNWGEFNQDSDDYTSVEHIYPQTPKAECWKKHFKDYTANERKLLRNSLGNLLPLSRAKNSSLQNKCFADKVNTNETIGFKYGSYSEIEISNKADWTPRDILERGLKLLDFMEKRWSISLGDKEQKTKILGLDFLSRLRVSP